LELFIYIRLLSEGSEEKCYPIQSLHQKDKYFVQNKSTNLHNMESHIALKFFNLLKFKTENFNF